MAQKINGTISGNEHCVEKNKPRQKTFLIQRKTEKNRGRIIQIFLFDHFPYIFTDFFTFRFLGLDSYLVRATASLE